MKLTEQEAMKLEGPELDAAFATLVMGVDPARHRKGFWYSQDGQTRRRVRDTQRFSSDIGHAYEALLFVMRSKGMTWTMELELNGKFHVRIRDSDWMVVGYSMESESLPQSICRALLLWKIRGES